MQKRRLGIAGGIDAAVSLATTGAVSAARRRNSDGKVPNLPRVSAEEVANYSRGAVDMELLEYRYSAGVMVAAIEHRGVYTIGPVLDSGSGVDCRRSWSTAIIAAFPGVSSGVSVQWHGEGDSG